jgi:hypothetical protein
MFTNFAFAKFATKRILSETIIFYTESNFPYAASKNRLFFCVIWEGGVNTGGMGIYG